MKILYLFIFIVLVVSCNNYSEKEIAAFDSKIQQHIDSTGLAMQKTEDGMYYQIINEGIGEDFIGYQDQVTFYYNGYLLNGNQFQAIDKNNPLKYNVNQLIIGWQDALMLLKNKGEIKIIIPPQLGYKKKKTNYFPANSCLIYHLWVLDVN